MVSISLKDFAVTGAFGPVTLGYVREALEVALGEPEATGGESRKHRRPNIWKYGDVEFFFDRVGGELDMIHIDRFNGSGGTPEGWGGLQLDPWVIRAGLAREVFIHAVEDAGCDYTVRFEPQFNQAVVVLRSGVEVGFVCEPDEFSDAVGLAWLTKSPRQPPADAASTRLSEGPGRTALCPVRLEIKTAIPGTSDLNDACRFVYSTSSESADQYHAAPGWFLQRCRTRIERHQTALRGRVASPSGEATVAPKQRRLRNLSVPTRRSLKNDGSIPEG